MAQDFENLTSAHDVVPNDPLSRAAFEHVRSHLHPTILNHSLRTFLYATTLSQKHGTRWHEPKHLPLLFTTSIFHDFGTTDSCNGPQRFEVEGADAAVSFLKTNGISQAEAHEVWVAIACHTCSGIAERISSLARLTRLAVLVDFKRADAVARVDEELVQRAEERFPRGEAEKVLGDAVVRQALEQPSKAPHATWPGGMARFKKENPGWEGVNQEF